MIIQTKTSFISSFTDKIKQDIYFKDIITKSYGCTVNKQNKKEKKKRFLFL